MLNAYEEWSGQGKGEKPSQWSFRDVTMREWRRFAVAAVACLGTVSLGSSVARAEFMLVSQNLSIDNADHTADFNLTFNQPPDFKTLDSAGRPADSFQIDFAGKYPVPGESFPRDLTSIVRGDEIHLADTLRIRSATGIGGADSGGWGPVVTTVPFSLVGDTVSFSVPSKDLGWSGRGYQYHAFSLQYDRLTASQAVTMVPTPTALQGGVGGLLVIAGVTTYNRRRARVRDFQRVG